MWHIIWGESRDFLVTSAYTDKQKIERAFAAELLAPAAGVAERISAYPSTDDLDEIEETADHFRVSPMIIEHQIRNQLADAW
jgi:Zn-dependent peptidase ImmA (M78 family)